MEQLQKTREELVVQHNNLCDQYNELLKKLKMKSTTKTRTERIEEKISIQIELKKIANRIELLSRLIDIFDINISLAKYKISPSSELSISQIETNNNSLLSLLESEYHKLDVLSTKEVLANEFKSERLKGLNKYNFGPYPVFVGVLSAFIGIISFAEILNLSFSVTNLILTVGVPYLSGAVITSFVMAKMTKQRIQVFNKLNNQLGVDSLSVENDNTFKEDSKLEQLIDKKINDIMIILMNQKEYQRLIELVSTEELKESTEQKIINNLGRKSVENILNDTTPFPDKVLRPVGFEIPKEQSDISWVEPYLEEDIETDERILTSYNRPTPGTIIANSGRWAGYEDIPSNYPSKMATECSYRTERDDTIEPGVLYRHLDVDEKDEIPQGKTLARIK